MYRSRRGRRRSLGIAVGATTVLLGLLLGYRVLRSQPGSASRPPATAHRGAQVAGVSPTPTGGYSPPRVNPPASPAQSRVDGELAQAETNVLDPAAAGSLPAPADSTGYPAVPVGDRTDPAAYATAFVTELLDRDYRRQSRIQLLAWAQAESAPNTLPGVPANLASRSLVESLAAPGAASSPVPSRAQWASLAASSASQSVAGLQSEVDPDWLALISTGWEPIDPALTMLTVTGTLTTSGQREPTARPFSLVVTLGSNGSRAGYGAVAVDDWTVS